MTKWRFVRTRYRRMMFPASIWIKSSESADDTGAEHFRYLIVRAQQA